MWLNDQSAPYPLSKSEIKQMKSFLRKIKDKNKEEIGFEYQDLEIFAENLEKSLKELESQIMVMNTNMREKEKNYILGLIHRMYRQLKRISYQNYSIIATNINLLFDYILSKFQSYDDIVTTEE